jgi:flavodoxin
MEDRGEQENNAGGLVVYSSKTGNTRLLAQEICRGLAQVLGREPRLATVEDAPDPTGAPWILLGFWADRGNGDSKARTYLKTLEGSRIGLFGTIGAYPDSEHAQDIRRRMLALTAERNTSLGCFLCQGKIDPALTEQFKTLPVGHPHAMTAERMQRHEEAAKHPDEEDLQAAVSACIQMLKAAP